MIYTYGDPEVYEELFRKTESIPFKTGVKGDYDGGIAFFTLHAALAWMSSHQEVRFDYMLYGVDCEESNLYWSDKDGYHRLIGDARLIRLSQDGTFSALPPIFSELTLAESE